MGLIGLIGRYDHTIDANGRLSIPAKFREYLTAYSEGTVIMTTASVDACIVAYPLPEWNAIRERASQIELSGASGQDFIKRKDFLRLFYSRAVECPLDKSGRILLPTHLRGYAALEKETVLVGCMNLLEIWDLSKWQAKEASVLQDEAQLQEAMASLGI
ncbi:MAG: division/cell wall cluster transcriptional repressor MraZ [Nitrospirae bacterium]|nr:division/cell wall cluster transcriptional repressor MraZ [Candidatus Troglogloeales bacterium]MBI3598028.1 division/cell wall cluster transcriptional repressor MraZ [Candidatus Troglogloeales bacterium]